MKIFTIGWGNAMRAHPDSAELPSFGAIRLACAALIAVVVALLMGLPVRAQPTMMLPGQFDVSPTGAALYTVPLEVPPGTGGMSPALTLDYNSDGGNGLLGVGWNLGGLPSIGRCPRTVAQDGVRGRVDFTLNDRFCLDGQRLMVTVGTYGAANSEYRTEIEGFTKIIAYGTAGNGPQYFKAWTKSGQIIEFGNTTDSRILAMGTTTARSWAANKISDTKGNYLTFTYTNDTTNGQAYPTRIDYTGNAAASLSPYNSVRFEYETRPDIIPLYIAGSMIKNTVRLKKIKTYEGASNVVKIYELVYGVGSSTARSRITSIKMCDGAGTACLPATTFSMTTASLTFPQASTNPVAVAEMGSTVAFYIGDWNGDGITDAMTWNPSTGANKWFTNNGALSFTTTANPIAAAQISGGASTQQLRLGDWNGDGIVDLMYWNPHNGINRWFTNNGALGFTQTNNPIAVAQITGLATEIYFGDWNGDGVSDVMWWDFVNGANRWFTNNGALGFAQTNDPVSPSLIAPLLILEPPFTSFYWGIHFGDWNGDGVTDAMWGYAADNTNRWFINDGTLTFDYVENPISPSVINWGELSFGDWNGDGVSDLMLRYWDSGENRWFMNNGALNFTQTDNPIPPSTISGEWITNLGDWNADGITDIMWHLPSSGSNRWFVNDGKLAFAYTADPIAPSLMTGTGGAVALGDWNGDGFEDPMFRLPSDGTNRWWRKNGQVRTDLLASVTTGLGSTTTVTFKPLTDASVYTKDATAVYPVIDVKAPFYVTSRVDAADGVGGNYSSTYSYVGAKIDVQGRGFLGFRQQVATDLQTSVVQTLTFRQDYPFIGFVLEDKKVRSGVVLNDRDNVYNATNLGGTRRFPYLESATEASKDLNGATFPTVASSYTYDAYGNPLTITVSTPDGAVRTTTNTYSNNTTDWILGRLLSATVASTTPDVTPTPTGCPTNCGGTGSVSFSIDNVSVAEGGSLVFTVTKTGVASETHNIDYASADGTAIAGSDYTAVSGTLSFLASETTKTISISSTSDTTYENDETVHINLSNPTNGATISDSQGVGTIANDDPAPSFSVNNVSTTEGGTLSFTITKSGSTALSHAVSYSTQNGTASGSDYNAVSGSTTFTSTQTTKTVNVATINDSVLESNETMKLNLSNATNGATISGAQGVGTINDNEVLVQSSAGVIQSPYVGTTLPMGFDFPLNTIYVNRIWTNSSFSTLIYSSTVNFCQPAGITAANYAFTGNGCEIVYSP